MMHLFDVSWDKDIALGFAILDFEFSNFDDRALLGVTYCDHRWFLSILFINFYI